MNQPSSELLACEIQRLIEEEQYTSAQQLLPSYADAVPKRAQELETAISFLKSAAVAVKVRKSHLLVALLDLSHHQRNSNAVTAKRSIDVMG